MIVIIGVQLGRCTARPSPAQLYLPALPALPASSTCQFIFQSAVNLLLLIFLSEFLQF